MSSRANSGGDAIWVKLDKSFFGINNHIYLCAGYIVPKADSDSFEVIRKEIEHYSNLGKVCIMGDLNSRTASAQPNQYVLQFDDEHDIIRPTSVDLPPRNNMDQTTNENGRKLLNLLSNYDMLIGNGCLMGDLEGNLTCSAWNGLSTNDLFVFHRDLLEQVKYLKIDENFQWYSDHKTITASLNINLQSFHSKSAKSWKKIYKKKMVWDTESVERYKQILEDSHTISKFEAFNDSHFESTDQAVNEFTCILNEVLEKVFHKKDQRGKRSQNSNNKRANFSYECQIAKRAFKRAQRQLKYNINDVDRRHKFIVERRNYRKAIYAAKRIAKIKQIDKLSQLEKYNSKEFWKGLKSIISPKDDSVINIDKDDWISHFNNVLNEPAARGRDDQFLDYIKSSLPTLENCSIANESLNKRITQMEISSTIKELKNGKAIFTDNIGNEALKHGHIYFKESLSCLLNRVFQNGVFPKMWSEGIIIPLHKKNDRLDVNNYRGIVISSCVSKVLLRILTKRIDTYMSQSGKWSIYQCGFKKDHRTEDNLFVLNTIYNKYVNDMNKDVYIAFIDFSKFFDKINREMMMYKLLKYDISGPIYKIIKSVYCKTGYQVQIGDDISPMFYGDNGLKQGCCMSPTLSSIYQNDLHDMFRTDECDPLQLGSLLINSISWADDLILLSLSQQGLQSCVSKLEEYCKKWGLEINELKTKCMVMSKKRGPFRPIHIYNTPIEYVKSMVYLGFYISSNGNIRATIQDRIAKASRVSHMVLQALRTNKNISAKLAMSIFDKQITPILLYGSSIWGIPPTHNLCYLEGQPENINTRSTVTNMLSSVLNRNIPFEYARRVGRRATDSSDPRKILIKFKYYSDKQELLNNLNSCPFDISNFVEAESPLEKVHHDFCKKSLNMSKFTSNTAVVAELGRYPVSNTAKASCIKYWLRINAGTKNRLLNEAYSVCVENRHDYFQGIQYLLQENGFGSVWCDPYTVHKDTFHKYFKQRLNDQHVQNWNSIITNSTRFKTLQAVHSEYKVENYIKVIRNPEIREIYTRLRIDMNILSTSKSQGNKQLEKCPLCNVEPESVGHFIFKCKQYDHVRDDFINSIATHHPPLYFSNLGDNEKLNYILNVDCPKEVIGNCCKFIYKIYTARLKYIST